MPLPAALAARLAKRGIKVNESKKEGEEMNEESINRDKKERKKEKM